MRIFVVSDLPHFVTGGAEMQAMRLIEAWLDAGHEVVCAGRRMERGEVRIAAHSIKVLRIRTSSLLGRWGRAASYFLSLAYLLLRHRRWMDVVYVRFLNEAAATTAVLKAARLLSAPLVSTPANTHGGDVGTLRSMPFSRLLIHILDAHCEAINLIAGDMAHLMRTAGFSGRNFSHIPNGVPIRMVRPPSLGHPLRLVAIGRLAPQKGYDVLLRAVARLRDQMGDARIRIIGDGPERERLRALAVELQVEGLVDWLGELKQEDVESQLEAAHAFLLPSRYEGMSNAGLEAMERSLPLIMTRCGGLDQYVNSDSGWVIPVEDEAALADALLAALAAGPEGLARMGGVARSCVEREFDIRVVGVRYLDLFSKLRDQASTSSKEGVA